MLLKISEMQFFIKHVVLDVIASVRGQMQRELRGLHGVLAGITETERSSTFEYENDAEGTPGPKFILSASAMALAHAAAFAIGARDLVKWMEPQMDAWGIGPSTFSHRGAMRSRKSVWISWMTFLEYHRGMPRINSACALTPVDVTTSGNCPKSRGVRRGRTS